MNVRFLADTDDFRRGLVMGAGRTSGGAESAGDSEGVRVDFRVEALPLHFC